MIDAWRVRLFRVVSHDLPVEQAVSGLARDDAGILPLRGWMHAADEPAAMRGLEIYAAMRRSRLHDVLREDYPKLHALLGDAGFDALVRRYLVAHPSRSPTLHGLGAALAEHLEASLRDDERTLADLARLEWARVAVMYDANVAALTLDELGATPPEERPQLHLAMVPAVRVVELRDAADARWLAIERARWPAIDRGETDVPASPTGPRTLLVFRHDDVARHRVISGAERIAIRRLIEGATLGEIASAFVDESDEIDASAARAFSALHQWIVDGIVRRA